MLRCPSTTPGSVSTSMSRSAARWCSAKPRTWAWAKRMSSRSRLATCESARSISCSDSRKLSGDQSSNFSESARTASSPRAPMSSRIASTAARTFASASARSAGRPAPLQIFRHRAPRSFRCGQGMAFPKQAIKVGRRRLACASIWTLEPTSHKLNPHCQLNLENADLLNQAIFYGVAGMAGAMATIMFAVYAILTVRKTAAYGLSRKSAFPRPSCGTTETQPLIRARVNIPASNTGVRPDIRYPQPLQPSVNSCTRLCLGGKESQGRGDKKLQPIIQVTGELFRSKRARNPNQRVYKRRSMPVP